MGDLREASFLSRVPLCNSHPENVRVQTVDVASKARRALDAVREDQDSVLRCFELQHSSCREKTCLVLTGSGSLVCVNAKSESFFEHQDCDVSECAGMLSFRPSKTLFRDRGHHRVSRWFEPSCLLNEGVRLMALQEITDMERMCEHECDVMCEHEDYVQANVRD